MTTPKVLGQIRPLSSGTFNIYSPSGTGNVRAINLLMVVTHLLNFGSPVIRIFHDDDGTTYDESTALYWDYPMEPAVPSTIKFPLGPISNPAGSIGIRSNVGGGIIYTLYGEEIP